jgi:predicted pyridoxine 5'-phosphate oxidase superfamily flavin-nucleotide-binding protein
MIAQPDSRPGGFHEGELAVQRRAGVAVQAARLAGMLAPGELRGGFAHFLADRTFAALTARAADGRLWVSPLTGPPGFLDATGATTLTVHTTPRAGDPLHGVPTGQPVGMVVVEFATRRRVRVNGTLTAVEGQMLRIEVEQTYGNCPQYIQQRVLHPTGDIQVGAARRGSTLTDDDRDLISRADTFFIGTTHATRGADASHRGGPPGFVRLDGERLWWPDYTGNNMFNTLGNLETDSSAALLVPDFTTGATVQLSGTAQLDWTVPGSPGDDDATGRVVRFTTEQVVSAQLLPLRTDTVTPYDLNPDLTDPTPMS